jgi:hypothetical protein
MQRFESLLLAPAIILGTPTEAGLNQKNSTSSRLRRDSGLRQLLIFIRQRSLADETPRYSRRLYPKMLNGARKNLSTAIVLAVISGTQH